MIHGTDLEKRRRTQYLRHEVGFVFQLHNLIPDLTLEENCLIPTVAAGTPRKDALARLHILAERTGLTHRLKQRIQKLSGGERQRTALCRALMNKPESCWPTSPPVHSMSAPADRFSTCCWNWSPPKASLW